MVVLGMRVGVGLPVLTFSQMNELREPFYLVCCRTFEKLDEEPSACLRNIKHGGTPFSEPFWY